MLSPLLPAFSCHPYTHTHNNSDVYSFSHKKTRLLDALGRFGCYMSHKPFFSNLLRGCSGQSSFVGYGLVKPRVVRSCVVHVRKTSNFGPFLNCNQRKTRTKNKTKTNTNNSDVFSFSHRETRLLEALGRFGCYISAALQEGLG